MRPCVWGILALAGCAGTSPKPDPEPAADDTGTSGCTRAGLVADVAATLVDGATFAEVTGTLGEAADVTVWATAEGGPDVAGLGLAGEAGAFATPLRGLRGETTYTVHVQATSAGGCEVVATELLTGDVAGEPPTFDVATDDGTHEGFLAVTYTTTGDVTEGIAVIDRGGVPVWNFVNTKARGALLFSEPAAEGEGFLAVFSNPANPPSAHVGYVGLDGEVADDLVLYGAHHTATQKVPGVRYATVAEVRQEVPGVGETCGTGLDTVIGDQIVEVSDDGTATVVWDAFEDGWDLTCHDFMDYGGDANDWTHFNALDYDAARDWWLVSVYWYGFVAVIDRQTKAVVFTLGEGGDCEASLEKQHGAEFTADGIAVYDNGGGRMLRYELDWDTFLAGGSDFCWLREEVAHPDGGRSNTLGDVDVDGAGRWYTAWGELSEIAVVTEDLGVHGDAAISWHGDVSYESEYVEDHGGFIAESIAFLPDLYFED
ncbi:MAG: aryl-sulfate sulfotransferase [Myxococcota bacterium]